MNKIRSTIPVNVQHGRDAAVRIVREEVQAEVIDEKPGKTSKPKKSEGEE